METAGRLGLSPSEVNDYTLRELSSYTKGFEKRQREESARVMWGAWLSANYARYKRMPNIRKDLQAIVLGQETRDVETRSAIAQMKAEAARKGLPLPKSKRGK